MKPNALITGAAGAIGSSLCKAFAQEGYSVIGLDKVRPQSEYESNDLLLIDLNQFCIETTYRERNLAKLKELFSDGSLRVLINNAAVQILKPIEDLTISDWCSTLNVNLLAAFLLTQNLLRNLEAASGSVINVASIHAKLTKPQFVAYATSKAALVGLTQSLAVELGPRIRVNAICPAAVDTPMLRKGFEGKVGLFNQLSAAHPLQRIGSVREISEIALFLASDSASFITGATIFADGGIGVRLHDPV